MPAGNASGWTPLSSVLLALLCLGGAARADDAKSWKEIETKYIFGFTTGSGIGLEGEKEFTTDTRGRFGKRDGRYNATETKYEFEFTPSQFVQIEFGALGSTHDIAGVTDLDDRRQVAFAGGFAEFRYLAIERTSSNPLSVTLAVRTDGARWIDETSGERVHNYEFETVVNADLELVRNRLYAGFNLLYEPEYTHTLTNETRTRSDFRRFGGAVGAPCAGRVRRRRGLVSPSLRRLRPVRLHRRCGDGGTDALRAVHAENVHDRRLEQPGLGTRGRQRVAA